MGNYSKREERAANTRESFRALIDAPLPAPPAYACSVCGIEKGPGVPIWALSERGNHTLLCTAHIPQEWMMPTPDQVEQARLRG
jgi:hypothetical protein